MSTLRFTLISHHLCPFVQRAAIVLAEKDVAFERVDVDLSNKPQWLLELSPTGKVPLLKVASDNGSEAVLFESVPICEYLEESCGGPKLHPRDPIDRARHRAWMEFATPTMIDAWAYVVAKDALGGESKCADFRVRLATIEDVLGDGPYFGGSAFSIVDAMFAPIFRFFDALGENAAKPALNGFARVNRWRDALAQRSSVIAAVARDYPENLRERMRRDGAILAD